MSKKENFDYVKTWATACNKKNKGVKAMSKKIEMRCQDCSQTKGCWYFENYSEQERSDRYCEDYKRKWWKFGRTK